MKRSLIAAVIAESMAIHLHCIDLEIPKYILTDQHKGKRGKKGKVMKDWQR